jgi:hypothetical protein
MSECKKTKTVCHTAGRLNVCHDYMCCDYCRPRFAKFIMECEKFNYAHSDDVE